MNEIKPKHQIMIGIIISLLLFSGCWGKPSPTATESPQPFSELPKEDRKYVMRAVAELSKQENIDPNTVELVSLEFTEFSDASLGVPEPGETYAQVITPGYIIILEHEGQQYEFHASDDRTVRVPE
ncbi:MAG: hypothetical protein R6U51_01585 [Anaerolineales bacterium]